MCIRDSANSVCAIHNPSCFSRCLRVPIAIGRFYKQCLWIPQMFLLTNPDLHHGLLCLLSFFTFWVTSWKSAREALTSRLVCFTTGFPGSPKGSFPQHTSVRSNPMHRLGVSATRHGGTDTNCRAVWE